MNHSSRLTSTQTRQTFPWVILLIGWFLTAFYLSSLSSHQVPGIPIRAALGLPYLDKAFHFVFYTLLGIIMAGTFLPIYSTRWPPFPAFVIPLFDEAWQAFHRQPTLEDLGDLAVDFVGILIGFYGWKYLHKYLFRTNRSSLQATILLLMLIAASLCFVVGYTWAWDVSGDKMLHANHR